MSRLSLLIERLVSFPAADAGGERDNLNTLLILALIIIPLVLVVIAFGEEIKEVTQGAWQGVIGSGINP